MLCLRLVSIECRIIRNLFPTKTLPSKWYRGSKSPALLNTHNFNVNNKMSQKSITSFFKTAPKTSPETKVTEEKVKEGQTTNGKTNNDITPTSSPEQTTKQAKRNSKRQRISSSDSETEIPENKVEDKTETSPKKLEEIKLNKNKTPKSYQSPKTKRAKIKQEKSFTVIKNKICSSDEENSCPEEDRVSKSPVTVKTKKEEIENEKSSPDVNKYISEEENSPDNDGVSKRKSKTPTKVKPKKEKKEAVDKSSKTKTPTKSKKAVDESAESEKKKVNKGFSNYFIKKEKAGVKAESEIKTEDDAIVAESEYNPAKAKYHPIHDACWSKGQEVPYLALARTLEAIEGVSARLKMIEILANYFRSVMVLTPEDLLPSVYMCLNQLAPAYHSLELGIAETYLMKAVGRCTGRSLAQMKAALARDGDLGSLAQHARASQATVCVAGKLRARRVFAALKEIAHMTGQASVNKKIAKIQSLYVACRYSEAKYLIRSLAGKLRVGLAEQSVLQALALAASLSPPPDCRPLDASQGVPPDVFKAKVEENALIIKSTYCACPNYESVLPVLLQHGISSLPTHCRLTPGVPLKPMLAHPTRTVHEVFNRFEGIEFTCEWKYDGERAQIHVPGEESPRLHEAAVFSRNQENNTSKYPDVVGRLASLLGPDVASCVLDCEAVAYDVANKQILPFQILSTRKRKEAVEADIKVQVCVFVFDLLYLNGSSLVHEPLHKRRELLRTHFREVEGWWQFATSRDCSSMEEVQQFLEESVRGSCEGLMVKTLRGDSAQYDIARRSRNWLKLKKDYLEGAGDTVDCVVLGGWRGKGRRGGALGCFLLACVDRDQDEFQALCKLGTGFSDEDLQTLTDDLQQHVIDGPRPYYRYDASHTPDVWFAVSAVWEVRCADLSLSPAHRAAIGRVHPDKGISLRFPRFVRVRPDKTPEQATSAQQIADMYLAQDQVKNVSKNNQTNHDDFY